MKHSSLFALVAVAFAGLVSPLALAQTGATSTASSAQALGTITGRVQNIVTGNYLNKARVAVKGTDLVAYTDEFGTYRLVDVPPGTATLEVFYTDLDVQQIPVTLAPGAAIERNIELTSKARYGTNTDIVKLDSFRVTSDRETDGKAIAINEQRFAPNLKNVMSTDELGDVLGSNVGEFLKFIPGLTAEYSEVEIIGVSVRVIGGSMTAFTSDGAAMVSANAAPGRNFNMNTLALNNISRIEVTKVPTPSSPADSLAGSVNMVSKSAFERSKPEFRFGLYLVGNGGEPTLKKTPHPYGDKYTLKTQEGWDFEYVLPASKNFGIVVTGMQSSKYTPQNRITTMWASEATGSAASESNPYFQQLAPRVAPRSKRLTAFSFKADWRVTRHSVLSLGSRWSETIAAMTGNLGVTANTGANGTPSVAGGVPLSFGPDFTIGATGRGGITLTSAQQYSIFENMSHFLKYRFDDGKWRLETNFSFSSSDTDLNPGSQQRGDLPHGFFPNVNVQLITPNRVSFRGIGIDGPQIIEAFDNNNRPIDIYDLRNYRINTASEDVRHLDNDLKQVTVDLRRRLDLFSFPSAVQVGGLHRFHLMDRNNTAAGAMTPSAAATEAAPYAYQVYVNKEHYSRWPFPNVYPARVHEASTSDPSLFSRTPAQIVAAENSRLNTSQYAEQSVNAAYVQGEARLFSSRLNVLTGVRFERTEVGGEGVLIDPGAAFVRNADGTFARNAQGLRIRRPEAGAAGSIQEVAVTRTERGYKGQQSYDGFYPSLHLTYNIRDNFQARLAYAKTYGRPDFPDVLPSATIQEADLGDRELADPNVVKGNITVTNTRLKPWTAQNYDFSLEYYTQSGGVFSAGAFLKEITDFFGTETRIATAADLEAVGFDTDYVGWFLQTKFNSGDARISGWEFNIRHDLRRFGTWGRYFTVFANGTQLHLVGNPHAAFDTFLPRVANWGFSFNWKRVTIMPKWNYRGEHKITNAAGFAVDGWQYWEALTLLDLNLGYRLNKRFTLSASVNNIFNEHRIRTRFGSQTPVYARRFQDFEYGAIFSLGIKGTF